MSAVKIIVLITAVSWEIQSEYTTYLRCPIIFILCQKFGKNTRKRIRTGSSKSYWNYYAFLLSVQEVNIRLICKNALKQLNNDYLMPGPVRQRSTLLKDILWFMEKK